VLWRIWYDDGSTFDSTHGSIEEAPSDGVIAVADARKTRPRTGQDYYLWLGDSWAAGNQADLEKWLRRALPTLKFGRWSSDAIYQETIARAVREWPHGD
jgi:hypothetical protein